MRRFNRVLGALAAVVVVGLAAGCAGPGGGGGGDRDKTLRLAYQAFPSGDLIVKNQRWLEQALPGYTIKWTKFESGASVNQAFLGDAVDIGAIGSSPVARGLSGASPIPYKVAFVLDVAGDNEALVARRASGVSSVEQLRGRRVATPFASTAHYSLLAALAKARLSASDVRLVDLQPQAIIAAWERGDIDAAYTWLPTLDQLRGSGTTLVTSRTIATDGKPTLDLAVVSDQLIARHPEVVAAWRKAQSRALELIARDRRAAATHIGQELNIGPDAALAQLEQGVYLTPAQVASPEWLGTDGNPGNLANNLGSAARFLLDQKQIDKAPTPELLRGSLYLTGLPGELQ
ncbi:ABC transporter substrate-binding protein [Pseudonocardia acaciae]|uniref:taurine ABC transporter substrate-binding protein n=1 Tax=Pseudonocardia acaciae TaxID=551276 RepID=UPI00048DDA7E|nr:ABC transporter substrate-binding protein [Pseudonocardia acaciae]